MEISEIKGKKVNILVPNIDVYERTLAFLHKNGYRWANVEAAAREDNGLGYYRMYSETICIKVGMDNRIVCGFTNRLEEDHLVINSSDLIPNILSIHYRKDGDK